MTLAIPTASSIKMFLPEFADVDDAVIEFAVEQARADMGDASNWTSGENVAIVMLTAHYVAAAQNNMGGGTSGGEIASESIGRLSISYRQPLTTTTAVAATPDDKASTTYGRRYLELVEGNFSGAGIV